MSVVPTIEVDGVSKRFGATTALDDVTLSVAAGRVLALLGPNGAGKTTLVRVLTTLLRPDSGRARVAGLDVGKDAKALRSLIGLAGQYAAVDELLTGRENLELVGLLYHLDKAVYRHRAQDALERMSLTVAGDQPVKTYSGGMRRRLDLAASLIGRPPVLFLDEPTTGLDPSGRRDTWDLIRQLTSLGTTVMLTTHYMDEVEALADRVAVLNNAEIVAAGTPTSIGGRDSSEVTIRFLLPDGATLSDLPVTADSLDQGLVQIRTRDELRLLHELTGWALEHDLALTGLSVVRVTLEDVYLHLTRDATESSEKAVK